MDRPYIYVYDADGLVNGVDYLSLSVPIHQDSEFRLRRIAGRPEVTAAGGIQVRDGEQRRLYSAVARTTAEQAVVPELVYAPGSAIGIDVTNVLRAGNATTGTPCYYSQLAFQGVRRFAAGTPRETSYLYREMPFAWSTVIAVTWSGRLFPGEVVVAGGRQFSLAVQDHDFELYHISLTEQRVGGAVQPSNRSVKLMLYDADDNQLMSAPVCDFFLGSGSFNYNSLFPCPPLVYPAGSQILFDVHSLLSNAMLPCALELTFHGVRRLPCQ